MPSLADLLQVARGEQADPQSEPRRSLLDDLLQPYQRAVAGAPTNPGDFAPPPTPRLPSPGPQGPAPGPVEPGSISVGDVLMPDSPLLASRRGVTLQQAALDSLIQALRQVDIRPGARELGLFGAGSTYRTPQQQADLYARKPGVAAPPGQSYHQQGLAIDLPALLQNEAVFSILRRLGWYQLPSEPWHWSAPGVRG